MLTVATVLKSGGIYTPEWVAKLKAGVEKHLTLPHRFVCLSDVEVPCERIPLEHNWPGWWSKMELYKLEGPVLAFDLDTAIVGNIDGLARVAIKNPFVMLRDFYRPQGLGSGVIGWNDSDVSACSFYDRFVFEPENWMRKVGGRGDQGFIEDAAFLTGVTRWQDAVPEQIVSYKVHCCNAQQFGGNYFAHHLPADARAICLHGKPKFRDMPANDAVRLAWEQAA